MSLQISQKPIAPSFQGRNLVIKNSARKVIDSYDANTLATELKQIVDESGLAIKVKGFTKRFSWCDFRGFSFYEKEKYVKAIVSKSSWNPFRHKEKIVMDAANAWCSLANEVKERIKLL